MTASTEPVYAYVPGDLERGAYRIESNNAGTRFRFFWSEVSRGEALTEAGRWFHSRAAALRAAAVDWDEAGSGGRLAATLRAAATRAERAT